MCRAGFENSNHTEKYKMNMKNPALLTQAWSCLEKLTLLMFSCNSSLQLKKYIHGIILAGPRKPLFLLIVCPLCDHG